MINTFRSGVWDDYMKCHVVDLPDWFLFTPIYNKQIEKQFIIKEITKLNATKEVKSSLETLERLYHTRVEYKEFIDFFKVINLLISNPLSRNVFNLKMKPLYALFKSYPSILFNEQTCRELATLSPFFPSAYDIDKIMTDNIQKITKNIELLKEMIL